MYIHDIKIYHTFPTLLLLFFSSAVFTSIKTLGKFDPTRLDSLYIFLYFKKKGVKQARLNFSCLVSRNQSSSSLLLSLIHLVSFSLVEKKGKKENLCKKGRRINRKEEKNICRQCAVCIGSHLKGINSFPIFLTGVSDLRLLILFVYSNQVHGTANFHTDYISIDHYKLLLSSLHALSFLFGRCW